MYRSRETHYPNLYRAIESEPNTPTNMHTLAGCMLYCCVKNSTVSRTTTTRCTNDDECRQPSGSKRKPTSVMGPPSNDPTNRPTNQLNVFFHLRLACGEIVDVRPVTSSKPRRRPPQTVVISQSLFLSYAPTAYPTFIYLCIHVSYAPHSVDRNILAI